MSAMTRVITPERQQRSDPIGRWVGIAGGVVLAASAFLPWAYSFAALDGMTLAGYPSPLQYCGMVLGVLGTVLLAFGLLWVFAFGGLAAMSVLLHS